MIFFLFFPRRYQWRALHAERVFIESVISQSIAMGPPVLASRTPTRSMASCAGRRPRSAMTDGAKLLINSVPRYLEKVLLQLMCFFYLNLGPSRGYTTYHTSRVEEPEAQGQESLNFN